MVYSIISCLQGENCTIRNTFETHEVGVSRDDIPAPKYDWACLRC
jgi:hypothetical protein